MILSHIKYALLNYFKVWWVPIACYLIPLVLLFYAGKIKLDLVIELILITLYINLLGNILSAIYQIYKRKWYFAILQVLVSIASFAYIFLHLWVSQPDYYGAYKTIPNDIDIYEPVNTPPQYKPPFNITPTKEDMAPYHLAINMGSQSGIYDYYTDYQPSELGSFYLKVFEVSSNDRLSADTIKKDSKIQVNSLEPQIYSAEFMIYEGSWGDKYGARIELWFNPADGGADYKVTERNYIVEGWMH